jgi:hypothetical protein
MYDRLIPDRVYGRVHVVVCLDTAIGTFCINLRAWTNNYLSSNSFLSKDSSVFQFLKS